MDDDDSFLFFLFPIMLQFRTMRKNIGWKEEFDGINYEVRVLFNGGRIQWRRKTKQMERWEAFEPPAEQWDILLKKTHARYVRRQAPYKDLQLVERLAAEHAPKE